jgi:hypothetical protein
MQEGKIRRGGKRIQWPIAVHLGVKEYGVPGEYLTTIYRVLRSEAIGNFNPVFCVFEGKRCLVESWKGDLSDPFRRTNDYLKELYIIVDEVPERMRSMR